MEEIDAQLIAEGVQIPARPLKAGLKITSRFDIVLNAIPPDGPILPGVFTPDQISLRIHDWMRRRYGDRLKLPFTLGRVVFPLRGSFFIVNCPVVLGSARFICDPATFGIRRESVGVHTVPICNVVNLVEALTADLARSLTAEEVVKLGLVHASAMAAFVSLHAVVDVEFVSEALGDLDAAVNHLVEHKPQAGLSKWASLQAVEKLVKAYINKKGGPIQRHHRLEDHVGDAVTLGLPAPPMQYVSDVQCSAGVRYGQPAVTTDDALRAHLVSLEMCQVAAGSIAVAIGRRVPRCPEPMIDGMPASEFLEKHARTIAGP